MTLAETVIWHDLECGLYRRDLDLWGRLVEESGAPVLDLGAGSGRVALELARRGHDVVAVDQDAELLEALTARAGELPAGAGTLGVVRADARDFALAGRDFPLCIIPMQTIQLLGGAEARIACLGRVRDHLRPGGVLAIAIAPHFDEFEFQDGDLAPLPDITEREGTIYASQPTAVRRVGAQVLLERRREVIDPFGGRRVSEDRIHLDLLSAPTLIAEGVRAGLRPIGTRTIPETDEHVGSEVVIFSA